MTEKDKRKIIDTMLDETTEEWHMQEKNIMYTVLKERFGNEVDDVIVQSLGERSVKKWQRIAEIAESNTLEDLLSLALDPLGELGWEFTVSEKDGKYEYRVTDCP